MTKIDSSSDDRSASATVYASGENILPSMPWRVAMGTKVRAMISSPKMLGFRTSTAARSTVVSFSGPVGVQREVALDVLHLDDGGVDDHSDGDGQAAQRHQVGVEARVRA